MLNFHVFLCACLPSHGLRRCLPILLLLFFSDCGGLASATCCRKRLQVAPAAVSPVVRPNVAKKPSGSAKVVAAAINSTRLGTTVTSRETRRSPAAESPGDAEQDLDRDVLVSDDPYVTSGGKKRESRIRTARERKLEKQEPDEWHRLKGKSIRGEQTFQRLEKNETSWDKSLEWTGEAVNGTGYNLDYRWSAWSAFTACSRSCGIGVKSRHRTCYKFGSISVQVGGERCRGNTEHYVTCNTQPCPPGSRDFRELQCAFFNGQPYAGHERKWRPARAAPSTALWNTTPLNPCALVCAPEKMNWLVVKFSRAVVDGTSCGPRSICTAGKCIPVGCDNKLYSHATPDWCGVCGGDNSTCYWEKGILTRNISAGYHELLHLPKSARHIKIVERGQNNVVLALRDESGQYLLNGDINTKYPSVTKLVSGAIFYYHHAVYNVKGLETLHAEGPINSSLAVVSFTPEKKTVIRLKFEYVLPIINNTFHQKKQEKEYEALNAPGNSEPTYSWQTLLYSQVLFGHIPSSLRNQLLSSTEQSPTTPPAPMPMHEVAPPPFRFSSPYGKTVDRTSQGKDSRVLVRPEISSSKRQLPPPAMPTPEKKMESLAVDGPYRGEKNGRNLNKGVSLWKQEPSDYYRRFPETHKGIVTHTPHIPFTSARSPAVTTPRASIKKQRESRKHIFVRIVAPSVSSTTNWRNEGRRSSSPKGRSSEEDSVSRQPKIESEEDRVQIERNQTVRNFQIQKKGFPIFLSAITRIQDDLDEYQTQDTRYTNRINTTSPDYNAVKTVGKSLLFSWRANVITPCSLTCDTGVQFTFFSCYNILAEKVDDKFCNGQPQPDPSYHECTRNQCQARWVTGLWSVCSRSCDLGEQFRSVRCWRMLAPGFDSSVHDYLCPPEETPISTRKCNEIPCGPQWEMSPWSECSSLCGFGIQRRHVQCNAGEEHLCGRSFRPPSQKSCFHPPCVNTWHVSEWTQCNGPCGRGIQRRDVMCINREGKRTDVRYCDKNTRPLTVQGCGSAPYCSSMWVPQAYEVCSASCGVGLVTRKVVCGKVVNHSFQLQSDAHCRHKPRPKSSTPCRSKTCGPQWYVTEWSKCSKTCGRNALRVRETTCYFEGVRSNKCKPAQKPATIDRCAETKCPENDDNCKDDEAVNCQLVKEINHCHNSYYKKACCRTCRDEEQVDAEHHDTDDGDGYTE